MLCKRRQGSKDDLHFCGDGERDVIGQFTKADNFFFGARFCRVKWGDPRPTRNLTWDLSIMRSHAFYQVCLTLTSKLVAWAANDGKAAVLVLLIQFFQASVLLGETAFGRDIDNKHHLMIRMNSCWWIQHRQGQVILSYIVLDGAEGPILVLDVLDSVIEKVVAHCSSCCKMIRKMW